MYPARAIRTMEPALPLAEAVAICGSQIVEVGSMETMQPWLVAYPHRIDERFRDQVIIQTNESEPAGNIIWGEETKLL